MAAFIKNLYAQTIAGEVANIRTVLNVGETNGIKINGQLGIIQNCNYSPIKYFRIDKNGLTVFNNKGVNK